MRQPKLGLILAELRWPLTNLLASTVRGIDGRWKQPVNARRRRVHTLKEIDDRVGDPPRDVPGHQGSGMQPGLGCPRTSTTGYARWLVMSKKDSCVQYRRHTPVPRTRRRGRACRRHDTERPTWPCELPMVGRRLGSPRCANRRLARAHHVRTLTGAAPRWVPSRVPDAAGEVRAEPRWATVPAGRSTAFDRSRYILTSGR
jgi:hypothetical protein